MFNFDEKRFFHDDTGHFPKEKPRYTMTEEVEHTAVQMRETINRLLRFEERCKTEFDDLMKNVSSDNVIFKTTMREAWVTFIQEVKNEINVFEGNVDSTIALFQKNTESNYATLSEDVYNKIAENVREFNDKVAAFESAYVTAFEAFKDVINNRLENYNDNHAQTFADYQLNVGIRLDNFEAEIREAFDAFQSALNETVNNFKTIWSNAIAARLDNQDAKISDAEMYMRTNLNVSLDNLLHEMENNGELIGVIDSDVVISVKYHGAKGDGVADDTTAFNAAINAASLKNGTIFIPAGTYLVKNTIDLSNIDISIIGDNGAIIKAGATLDNLLVYNVSHSANHTRKIANLTLDGNNTVKTVLNIQGAAGLDVQSVVVLNPKNIGVDVNSDGISGGTTYEVFMDNIKIINKLDHSATYNGIGLVVRTSDCVFNNIVPVDMVKGVFVTDGMNVFTSVHPWCGNETIFRKSVGIDNNALANTFTDCYFDTVATGFVSTRNATIAKCRFKVAKAFYSVLSDSPKFIVANKVDGVETPCSIVATDCYFENDVDQINNPVVCSGATVKVINPITAKVFFSHDNVHRYDATYKKRYRLNFGKMDMNANTYKDVEIVVPEIEYHDFFNYAFVGTHLPDGVIANVYLKDGAVALRLFNTTSEFVTCSPSILMTVERNNADTPASYVLINA